MAESHGVTNGNDRVTYILSLVISTKVHKVDCQTSVQVLARKSWIYVLYYRINNGGVEERTSKDHDDIYIHRIPPAYMEAVSGFSAVSV